MLINQIRNISLFLFVACFFIFPSLQTILIGLSFLMVLFDKKFYSSFSEYNKLGVAMMAYFIIVAVSLFYTNNLTEGIRSIETKFSFLVFPIFLPYLFSLIDSNKVFKTLLFSGIIYVFLSYLTATIDYSAIHKTSVFFYGELGVGFFQDSSFVHPTYAAFFFNLLIAFLGIGYIDNSNLFKSKIVSVLLIGVFSIFILMLSSKFGILALLINFFFLFFYFIRKRQKVIKPSLILVGFLVLTSIVILQTPLKVRFEKAYTELVNPTAKEGSTKTRKDVWKVTTEIIRENPMLGVGTGDIRDELALRYEQNGQSLYLERKYDSHQQFLQVFASLGISGFLILLVLFGFLFWKAIKQKNFLLLIFTSLFFLFGMVESMLERQAGIAFFVFFGLLLYSFNPSKSSS
ncbi:MAG: O-antigen ligase family protein [Flavobacteriales bacterium]